MLGIVAITLIGTVASIMLFEIFIRDLFTSSTEATSGSGTRFREMKGNIPYFFSIIFFVWIDKSILFATFTAVIMVFPSVDFHDRLASRCQPSENVIQSFG